MLARRAAFACLWIGILSPSRPLPGEEPLADTCILEMSLPAGAVVTIDGREYGDRRRFTFRELGAQRYTSQVEVRFRSGGVERREVFIEGGRRLALAVADPRTEQPELYLPGGENTAYRAAFSPDGKYLLTAFEKSVMLWDTATRRALRTYSGFSQYLWQIGWSGDGRTVYVNGDKRVVSWDRDTGRVVGEFTIEGNGHGFSPDGRYLLVDSHADKIELWRVASGELERTLAEKIDLHQAAFTADSRRVAVMTRDGRLMAWEIATGSKLCDLPAPRNNFSVSLAFNQPGNRLLASYFSSTGPPERTARHRFVLWDLEAGRLLRETSSEQEIARLAFTADGRLIGCAWKYEGEKSVGSRIEHDPESLERIRTWPAEKRFGLQTYLTSDGLTLFDGVYLWNTESGESIGELSGRQLPIKQVTALPETGRLLLTALGVGFHFDSNASAPLRAMERPAKQFTYRLASSPGSDRVYATGTRDWSSKDYGLWEWDLESGAQRELSPLGEVYTVLHHVAGERALLYQDGRMFTWDLVARRRLAILGNENHKIFQAALSPDGRWVATQSCEVDIPAGEGEDVRRLAELRDALTGRYVRTFVHRAPNSADDDFKYANSRDVAFTPAGDLVTLGDGGHDKNKRGCFAIWETATGRRKRLYRTTDRLSLIDICFSDDGRLAVTTDEQRTLLLWDLPSGKILRRFIGAHNSDEPPALTPDGRRLFTLYDGALRQFDLATGEEQLRVVLLNEGDYEQPKYEWLAITPQGLFDGSPDARAHVGVRIGTGLNVVPIDRFFQDFFRPGLLPELSGGRATLPEVQFAKSKPPNLRIVSPAPGEASTERVTLVVEAVDQGGGIGNLSVFQNGARIVARGETNQAGSTLRRTFEVGLVDGRNAFRITAAGADGSWEAEPTELTLVYNRPVERPASLHLVAVGVSKYADPGLQLQFAARDASAIAAMFQTRGKSLYEQVHVTELIDADATRENIRAQLKQAAQATEPEDTLVVFFAGHGAMLGQRYYFIPQDLKKKETRLEDDLRRQGIAADEISDYLGLAPALKRVLIFDTCASGGALELAGGGRSSFALRGAIERLSRSQGVFTLAASAANEEAQEARPLGHGVLSYALLAGLGGVDDGPLAGQHIRPSSPERVVDVMEWFSYAAGHVPRLTERYFGIGQDVQTSAQGSSFPVLPVE